MQSPYASVNDLRESDIIASSRSSVIKNKPPFITGGGVANVTLALTVSVTLGAIAIVTDIAGYLIFSGANGHEISAKAVTDFAFIPELGSAAFSTFVLLALMYSGAFSAMIRNENTQCMRVLMWGMVVTNFIINTALGFGGDHLFNHDQHADLMQECLWSKLVSLAVLLLIGGVTIALDGEKVIVNQLYNLYDATEKAVNNKIGPGTEYHENGCIGVLRAWCTSFSSESRNSSDEPTEEARKALLHDMQKNNDEFRYYSTGRSV